MKYVKLYQSIADLNAEGQLPLPNITAVKNGGGAVILLGSKSTDPEDATIKYYAQENPDAPEAGYTYPRFKCLDTENNIYQYKWQFPRKQYIWFRPFMKFGENYDQDLTFNDIVYNDIPYQLPHMYAYRIDNITTSTITTTIISAGGTVVSQDNAWGLKLPNQYGSSKMMAKSYYKFRDPQLMNDGLIPKTITLTGKLIKIGEAARTLNLVSGMNIISNYNIKDLDLNKLATVIPGIYIMGTNGNTVSPIDTTQVNILPPGHCCAIQVDSDQTYVIPENFYNN